MMASGPPTADIETRRRILEAMLPFVTDEDRMVLDADDLFEEENGNPVFRDWRETPCRACLMGWEIVATEDVCGVGTKDWPTDIDIAAACKRLGLDNETEATRRGRAADVVREALRALA